MKRKVLSGAGLIVIGVGLLLRAAGVPMPPGVMILWLAIMALGIALAVRGWKREMRGRVFWGMTLTLTAGFALVMRLPDSGVTAYYFVPWTVLVTGIALLAAYLTRPRSLQLLVAALAIMILGCAVFLAEFGMLDRQEVIMAVKDYWAVALILFGAGMLVPLRPAGNSQSAVRHP